MNEFTRRPGDPFPYREHNSWYWMVPGSPVRAGPFSSYFECTEDIIAYNTNRADRIIAIARVCHELNRAFCVYLGDMSQPAWEDAPEWQRQSAIKGVEFHIQNPTANDSASHDAWLEVKHLEGWVYGTIKDPEASPPTHPCIVPFEQLPPAQQLKDTFFRSTVHRLWDLAA